MKHSPYMASSEMMEFMWLSAMRQMLENIIETTTSKDCKDWRRKFKYIDTMLEHIIAERCKDFSPEEAKKADRRIQKIKIKVYAYDDYKVDHEEENLIYKIGANDWWDLLDAAFLNCLGCAQGEIVKDCPRRKMYHRLGLQVHKLREKPGPGECEFRGDQDVYAVSPQYQRIKDQVLSLP